MQLILFLVACVVIYGAIRYLMGPRTTRVSRERHDVLRLPDGGMVHDQDCRNHACRNHVRENK